MRRVKVRRHRPTGLAWAMAFLCVMLAVYGVTLSAKQRETKPLAGSPSGEATLSFEGAEAHLVQLGAFSQRAAAQEFAAEMRFRGSAGYVLEESVFRVMAAGYAAREDAESVCRQLLRREGISACVYSLSALPCEVRFGGGAQADAILCADAALRLAERTLASLADLSDIGDLSVDQAQDLLAVLESDLSRAAEKLRSACSPTDGTAAGFLRLCEGLCAECARLSGESAPSGLSFSSQIRYNHIDTTVGHIHLLKQMGGSE